MLVFCLFWGGGGGNDLLFSGFSLFWLFFVCFGKVYGFVFVVSFCCMHLHSVFIAVSDVIHHRCLPSIGLKNWNLLLSRESSRLSGPHLNVVDAGDGGRVACRVHGGNSDLPPPPSE